MHNTQVSAALYACVILRKNNHVLLMHRTHTQHHPNVWAIPGGAMEVGEIAFDTAVREAQEELGIIIEPASCRMVHIMHTNHPDRQSLGFYLLVESWQGEPVNKEPEKHGAIAWFALDQLPADTSPYAQLVLSKLQNTTDVQISTIRDL